MRKAALNSLLFSGGKSSLFFRRAMPLLFQKEAHQKETVLFYIPAPLSQESVFLQGEREVFS